MSAEIAIKRLPRRGGAFSSNHMSDRLPSRRENILLVGIFCTALLAHFYFATFNWTSGFMPGHEFRQTQTALICRYIDEQNNFSLLYETPLVGKPWVSILLEVPLYEWSVVGLSRAAGLPHFMAARTISLTCFYLMLPALYLLLGRFGLSSPRRLLVLALLLVCPVYIFYSRAFLMESMELMCCAWFLLGFVRMMDQRRMGWLALTIVAGTAAALIKSATFAVWLLPAAGYGAWMLWRDLRAGRGWKVPLQTVLWGGAGVVVALGTLRAWINFTDPYKAAHASAYIYTAKKLSQDNWGLLNFSARFSGQTWGILLERWQDAIMAPWLIGLSLAAGLAFFRPVRRPVLGLAAVFVLAQMMFPFAYAYQDYYFYACTVFLVGALAFVLIGALESRLPKWVCALVIAVPFAGLAGNYWRGYRQEQIVISQGGFPYTEAIRDLTPRNSVIIIAGADWCAIIPYYAQRKALMIRTGLEDDSVYLNRAFDDLAGEKVSALVLVGNQRNNQALVDQASFRFGLDSSPTFSHATADVYFDRSNAELDESLKTGLHYTGVTFRNQAVAGKPPNGPFKISANLAQTAFPTVSPAPFQAYFAYGLAHEQIDWDVALFAHPDSDLWVKPPADATKIEWDYGIVARAYERTDGQTDGVEFTITGESPTGSPRLVYRRLLDPANRPADQGRQREVVPYRPLPGEVLRFSTRENQNSNFDWAYWARIEVK